MAGTGRPDGVDEGIVEIALHVAHELLDSRRDAERLDVGGRVADDRAIRRASGTHDVALEQRDGVSQAEGVGGHASRMICHAAARNYQTGIKRTTLLLCVLCGSELQLRSGQLNLLEELLE